MATVPPAHRRTVRLAGDLVSSRVAKAVTGEELIGAVARLPVLVETPAEKAGGNGLLGVIEVRPRAVAIGLADHAADMALPARGQVDDLRASVIVTVVRRPVARVGRGAEAPRKHAPTAAVMWVDVKPAAIGPIGEVRVVRVLIGSVVEDPTLGHLGAMRARVGHSAVRVATTADLQRVPTVVVREMAVSDQMIVDRGPMHLIVDSATETGVLLAVVRRAVVRRAVVRRAVVLRRLTHSAMPFSVTAGHGHLAVIPGLRTATVASPYEEPIALPTTPSRRVHGA